MFMSQKRVYPRWKNWKQLATQQCRLRNLIQIIGLNIGVQDLEGKICGSVRGSSSPQVLYYYTLHMTAMSAPFYTSEKLDTDCPKWKELNSNDWSNCGVFGGIEGFVLRLWCHYVSDDKDDVIAIWGINLTGLEFIGPNLSVQISTQKANTIFFLMPGGFYSTSVNAQKFRVSSLSVTNDDLRLSYSLSAVNRLSTVQQNIIEKAAAVIAIKQKIASGDYVTADTRGSAMLRRLLNKNKPKSNYSDLAKLKESIEIARFRLQTLEEEKIRLSTRLANNQVQLEALVDGNQLKESRTMEKYRLLQREVQAHREWQASHVQRREAQLHAKAILNFRIKQLISELQVIYPVEQNGDKFFISGVHLPDSENLTGCDEVQISVGLGFVAHVVQMISIFLQVPLRYPVIHVGSRSRIVDLIADKMPDSEREFPLFCKGKDKLQFNYAVYLLNKNVAALRWLCGLTTHDLRCTLPNLAALLRLSGKDLPVEPQLRSPASSTLDLASSSISFSSPVQNNFPARPFQYGPHVSVEDKLLPAGPSQLFGKDSSFQRVRAPSQIDVPNTPSITNNMSFSLDKGLHEIDELKKMSDWLDTDSKVSNLMKGGSESNLTMCLSRDNSTAGPLSVAEDAASSTFLKNWEANSAILSDEDSDMNSGVFIETTASSVEGQRPMTEGVTKGRGDSDAISEGLEAIDDSSAMELGATKCPSAEKEESSPVVENSGDGLLDNVTDRTEALANQASSFILYRSRVPSTLGNTN